MDKVYSNNFKVSKAISDSYSMDNYHFHEVFEIYLSQTSDLKFFVDNMLYTVEKNDLFIFNNMDLHRIIISPNTHYERYVIIFNQDYVKDMNTSNTDLTACFVKRPPGFCHKVHLSDPQAEKLISMMDKAMAKQDSMLYGDDVYEKIILSEILIFVNEIYRDCGSVRTVNFGPEYDRIKPILSYIDSNIPSKLSLNSLAELIYISKYHLCKIFKKATGYSVIEYIIFRRILKATDYLRQNIPVSHVAELTGFKNDCNFITTFKNHVGITPKQYAKNWGLKV